MREKSFNAGLNSLLKMSLFLMIVNIVASSEAHESGMALISGGNFNFLASKKPTELADFYIDIMEVTQKDFITVMGINNFFFKGENHPAEQISWFKATAYCEKIGKRLPTELEWEIAAKGSAETIYFWGNDPDAAYAWYGGDYDLGHHPVGKKKPNAFGLFDTAGNVWEWTSTSSSEVSKYSGEKVVKRVVKGGSFNVSPNLITPDSRMELSPKSRLFNVGFRCAK